MGDRPAHNMFSVRRTCLEMLTDRGYTIGEEDLHGTYASFEDRFGNPFQRSDLTILATHKDDPAVQVFVFFSDEPKLGVKQVKVLAEQMRENLVAHAILVTQEDLTPFAQQCISEMAPKFRMELFQERELLVNITRHSLVPTHTVLSRDEKQGLLERYKVKDTQLPRIQFTDAVARYLGMQRGQVARIVRGSETAGRYVTYRLCV